jgi:S-adenosylmethionine uptake transporter
LALTPASVLAPFQYTAILWATMLGWLVWRDGLSPAVAAGNALIIASGLVVLNAERRRSPPLQRNSATPRG